MAWQGIEGHDPVVAKFRRALSRNRLASTFLFVGPSGIGKRAFAEKLAQALLCSQSSAAEMSPCESCISCRQVSAHTHPDLILIEKPADKSTIPLAAFVGDDSRGRVLPGPSQRLFGCAGRRSVAGSSAG